MKPNRLVKIVLMFLLAISAFHLSGIETAFCDDGLVPVKAAAAEHGCSICQPGQHSVNPQISNNVPRVTPVVGFSFVDYRLVKLQAPPFSFFRPPISL